MKLVPNAKDAWKWFSVQSLALIAALQVAWETLPPDVLALIPPDWRGYITIGIAIAGVIGRLKDQGTAK